MNYEESVSYIHGKYGKGQKVGLQNMKLLLARLGNPHKGLRFIHVAGTNGKGSTCAFMDSILREAGYKVGLYTSPFLMRYNERIRVNGCEIPDETVAQLTTHIEQQVRQMEESGEGWPTVFEIGTALMFSWFAQQKVDYAVVEVGLGGRLDPTNVLTPCVSAITRIGLDHTRVLGDTLQAIATEKGGIIKAGAPVVLQAQEACVGGVIEGICAKVGAPYHDLSALHVSDVHVREYGSDFCVTGDDGVRHAYHISLCGAHQVDNAVTALKTIEVLPGANIAQETIQTGLANAKWPGRLEWLGNILLDGAHNPQGARMVSEYVRTCLEGRRIIALTGMMADKDVAHLAKAIASFAHEVLCVAPENMARAIAAPQLADIFRSFSHDKVRAFDDTQTALCHAQRIAEENDVILVCGSLYLVGEVRKILTS